MFVRGDRQGISFTSAGLLGQSFGYVTVRYLYFLVTGAGVGELVPAVSVGQVSPDARHSFGDVKVAVFFGHHLQGQRRPMLTGFHFQVWQTWMHHRLQTQMIDSCTLWRLLPFEKRSVTIMLAGVLSNNQSFRRVVVTALDNSSVITG